MNNATRLLTCDSTDDDIPANREFLLDVELTMQSLLRNEDLDGDGLITVDDCGPKVKLHMSDDYRIN